MGKSDPQARRWHLVAPNLYEQHWVAIGDDFSQPPAVRVIANPSAR